MKKITFFLTALFITMIGYSQTFIVDNITYTITSPTPPLTVEATDYNTAGGTVVNIPATVTDNSMTYSVTSIGVQAFQFGQLTSVTIPDSVLVIRISAFANNQLTNVSIGENVVDIQTNAFFDNDLTSITIPSSVATFGFGVFSFNSLTSVISEAITPPTITTGGANDSFNSDRSGIDLTIPLGTTGPYVTDPGALWTGFNSVTEMTVVGSTFVMDFITYEVTSIPNNTVEAIDYDTAGGTAVNIPATVTFSSVTYDVTSVGNEAFFMKQLTAISLPNSLENIGVLAFSFNQIANVTIPASVTSIGNNSFEVNELTSIVIPNTVTNLGSGSFANNLLTSVTIPSTISSLLGTFTNNELTTVTIPGNITTIGDLTFANNELTSITISEGVTQVGNAAFRNNQLTDVVIPSSVTNIGMAAFDLNPLATVTSVGLIPATIVTGANDSFGVRSNTDLYIPTGTLDVYVTDPGALWTGFNMVFEGNLGTSDFEFEHEISVITTTDMLHVIAPNNITLQQYALYSISGAIVASGVESNIATTSIASGIYILKLDFNEGTAVKKVVVY